MPTNPTTYTGRTPLQTAQFPQTQRSTEKLGRDIIGAKKDQVNVAKQEEQSFLAGLKVDPISIAAKKLMEKQAGMIEGFNDKWSDIYAQGRGSLTMQQKAEMQSDKLEIQAWQGEKQSGDSRYLKEIEAYSRNPERYDDQAFMQGVQSYLQNGELPPNGILSIAPADEGSFLKGLKQVAGWNDKGSSQWNPDYQMNNDGSYEVSYVSTWDPDDAYDAFRGYMYDPSGANTKKIIKEWGALDEMTKSQYLDEADQNNDGLTEDEKQNAIENYAWDKYQSYFFDNRGGRAGRRSKTSAERKADQVAQQAQPSYKAEHGVSPKETGYGYDVQDDGIVFTWKSSLPESKRGFWVDKDSVDSLPKGAFVSGDRVFINPSKLRPDGTVEFGVDLGKAKLHPNQELAKRAMANGIGEDNWREGDDGRIYVVAEGKGFSGKGTASYSKVRDKLDANFDDLNEVYKYKFQSNDVIDFGIN